MITGRDIDVLQAVCRYYVLSRIQIQRLCFPSDENGRITRRRLQVLVENHLLNRHTCTVFSVGQGTPGAAYFPARKGCEFLAEHFDNERFLATPTRTPLAHHLAHWLAVSETHITFDAAISEQNEISIGGWLNEWDVCNPDEHVPDRRFSLYTVLRESPRLVAAPDAGFLLCVRGFKKVFYLEQDRGTSGVRQIAASKTPGYAELAGRGLQSRHFPESNVPGFSVLLVTTSTRRRDALKAAFQSQPGKEHWKFAAVGELSKTTMFKSPVWHSCDGLLTPLVKDQVVENQVDESRVGE
jgi:Replication-relaxation